MFIVVGEGFSQPSKMDLDSAKDLKHKTEIGFLAISSEDNILDLGTGAGFNLIPIANEYPSLHFTVEDIDPNYFNKKLLLKRINKTGNKIKIDNFTFCYGTETSTNLPGQSFNKVFVFDVIHEMTYKKEMLSDIKRILQKEGAVYIEEILVHKTKKKERACNYPYLTEAAFKKIMEDNGYLIKREATVLDTGHNKYIKIFECVVN